jgi:acyl carrier protein
VAQAAAVVRDHDGDKRIVAYLVPQPGVAVDDAGVQAELARYLRARLPEYMMPATVIPLAEIPLTPNGKLDRGALPAPGAAGAATGRGPRNHREEVLCRLFADLLGVEKVGIDIDFFAHGGHSLLATRLIGRIRNELDVDVKATTVFRNPTVAQLSAQIEELAPSSRPRLGPMTVEEKRS